MTGRRRFGVKASLTVFERAGDWIVRWWAVRSWRSWRLLGSWRPTWWASPDRRRSPSVIDGDSSARDKTAKIKVASANQPVLPAGSAGVPFVPVEFAGLTVTPYVNQAGRLAYSLKATGVRALRPGRPGAEPKDNAA